MSERRKPQSFMNMFMNTSKVDLSGSYKRQAEGRKIFALFVHKCHMMPRDWDVTTEWTMGNYECETTIVAWECYKIQTIQ